MDSNQLDLDKLVRQAKLLSEMMGGDAAGTDEAEKTESEPYIDDRKEKPDDDQGSFEASLEKAMQMMKAVQMLNASSGAGETEETQDQTFLPAIANEDSLAEKVGKTEKKERKSRKDLVCVFDEKFNSPNIKALKAAVPYVEAKHQKTLALWIKVLEIQRLLELTAGEARLVPSECRNQADWRREMLLSMRPYLNEEKRFVIDLLLRLTDISELTVKLEEIRNGGRY
ncbi:MAG: hypothetical protein LBU32_04965 [Clostridiales bacterium]|nr:hypothetical protein [Clostridiales bacterium]